MTHPTRDRRNHHPDMPGRAEGESYFAHLGRVALWLVSSPPAAPPGFRLIECDNDSRHHPLYEVESVFSSRTCPDCAAGV